MAAYVISDVTIRDAEAIEAYRARAAASIAQHGGRYLVRGGEVERLEGDWSPGPLIIVEFPDMDTARLVPLRRICRGIGTARRRAQPQSDPGRGDNALINPSSHRAAPRRNRTGPAGDRV